MAIDIKKPNEEEKKEGDTLRDSLRDERDPGKTLMQWKFSEYEEHKRGRLWYISAAVISVLFLIYAIASANFLFALIIIIIDLIILIQANRKPDRLDFKITEEGIVIGSSFHPYQDINKFWLIYDPPKSKTLYLNFKATIRPDVTIPLENKNPLRIREILLEYLEEDLNKEEDSSSEQIRKFLKL